MDRGELVASNGGIVYRTAASNVDSRQVQVLSDELSSLKRRLYTVERAQRSAQLGDSSIENGGLVVFDEFGIERLRLGNQPDGTFVSASVNNPNPPPIPNAPVLEAGTGTIKVTSAGLQGGLPLPADFAFFNVYVAPQAQTEWKDGTILTNPDTWIVDTKGNFTPHTIWLTAVNLSGKESEPGEALQATPTKVVSDAILNGAITELQLASDAVSAAKIAAGAVTETKISDNAVTTPKVIAGAIQAAQLATDAVVAGKVAANAITARELTALSVTADKVAANAITAAAIEAGAVTAAKLTADLVLATRVIVGSASGDRVELHPTSGLQGYKGGVRTLHFDPSTGNLLAVGQWRTGTSGERIEIYTDGTMRYYQTDGRYTQFNNIPNALSMTGPSLSGRQGGVFLADTGVETNYGPPTGGAWSRVNVDTTGVDIYGAENYMIASEKRAGANSAENFFQIVDGNDVLLGNSQLLHSKHQGTAGSEAKWGNLAFDIALTFAFQYVYVNDYSAAPQPIAASNVALPSGTAVKQNRRRLKDSPILGVGKRAKDLVQKARAQEYEYTFEDPANRPSNPPGMKEVYTGFNYKNGRPIVEYVPNEWPEPAPAAPKHIGPMAEDFPPEYRLPPVAAATGMPEVPWLSMPLVAGLAYDAAADVADDVDALALRVSALERTSGSVKSSFAEPDTGTESGALFERDGILYYKNSIGQVKRVA